ncbi:MAG: DUF1499 domain-containing protein [Alphaproteobacteria bacterium]|nr:DUF1499 domain-containing protein [Alphaproteobacteria bacterium]
MRHQPLLAKISLAAFVAGFLCALTASLGTRFGLWDYTLGLKILMPAVAVGCIGLVAGLAWIWRALAINNSEGWRYGAIGLIGSALLVGIPADYLWLSVSLPPIHDVSTDIGDAPKFETLLSWRKDAPNPASYDGPAIVAYDGVKMTTALAQKYAYPDIKPLERLKMQYTWKEFYGKMFWRALNLANAFGWQIAAFDYKTGRIEATDTSFWFGVTSDIVIRIRPAGALGVRIDIRSKSRVGQADCGRNAEIIRPFLVLMRQ